MGKLRVISTLTLILSLCLLSLIMQAPVGQCSVLWYFSPKSDFFAVVQAIEDVSGDGHEDVFVATDALTGYENGRTYELPAELVFLDGRTGKPNRSLTLGMTSIREAIFVNGHVVISEGKILKVYDSNFDEIYDKTFSETPRLLRILSESQIIFSLDNNVTALNLENNENIWTWMAPAKITNVLVTPTGIICAYPDYLSMLSINGTFISGKYVPRQKFQGSVLYTESLHKLDDTRFLYLEDAWLIFGQSPSVTLSMWEISNSSFSMEWKIEIGGRSANKPFAISDIDGDGVNDFICRRKGDYGIAVFSGKTGQQVYSTGISGLYIYASTRISDIDGDGIAEIALNPYDENAWHRLYITSFKRNRSISYEIGFDFDLYDYLVSIQDVDGDNFLDIIGARLRGTVEAYQGFDSRLVPDSKAPTVSILSPQNKAYSKVVPLTFTLNEPTSWIGYSLDRQANITTAGNTTLIDLTDGSHSVTVYANDTAGNMGASSTIYFAVDTTKPTANAGINQTVNEDTRVTFDASASRDENGIAGYTWTFEDVTLQTLTGKNPAYTFATPGTYAITLNVTDATGNWATDTFVISVLDVTKPVAYASQDQTVNVGAVVSFADDGSTDNVGIAIYLWDFGDGTTETGKTTSHIYTSPGTFTVTLTVKDPTGNTATDSVIVTVLSAEPLWWVVGMAVGTILIAALGSAVYFKIRKH
jgi:PKD repeat protein